MRRVGLAIVIATGSWMGIAQAGSYGCQPDSTAGPGSNHNAENPTIPGTIGGCGTGEYKLHKFKKEQKELEERQQMIGPKATGSGENL
jgi:hypothetical protein